MKKTLHSETAYLLGILALTFGTALMEKADFGVSMVVAPAYLVYLKVSEILPAFTFGMAEYSLQALLIIVLSLIMKGFRKKYLFSFCYSCPVWNRSGPDDGPCVSCGWRNLVDSYPPLYLRSSLLRPWSLRLLPLLHIS